MKAPVADFLIYDEATKTYREDPEQAVRDDVEKHYWLHVVRMIAKDWRLYIMLIPMLLVFLFIIKDAGRQVNEKTARIPASFATD